MFKAFVGVARRAQALEGLGSRLEQGAEAAWASGAGPSTSGAAGPQQQQQQQQQRSHATHSHHWQQSKSSSGDPQGWDLLHDQARLGWAPSWLANFQPACSCRVGGGPRVAGGSGQRLAPALPPPP